MKILKITLMLSLWIVISPKAFAECYEFEGKGPDSIGNISLPASASEMCFSQINQISGSSSSRVTLSDDVGDLMIAGASIRRARKPQGEIVAELGYGSSNGANVDFSGISIVVEEGNEMNPNSPRTVRIEETKYLVYPR